MNIGLDLDHTVYGFPEFFREFIPAMIARGHKFFCTSNQTRGRWTRNCKIMRSLGIDPTLIDPQFMPECDVSGERRHHSHKAPVADRLDIVFDDHADEINPHCKTPVVKMPGKKAADKGALRR